MPWSGTTSRGSGTRFAVGKPSVRPRLSPWAIVPRMWNGAPRKRAAVATSPAATSARVWLEGQHGVRPADHLAVAEVHAVELADGEITWTPGGVGEPDDVHQPRKPTMGLSVPSPRGSARAMRPASSRSRTGPSAVV